MNLLAFYKCGCLIGELRLNRVLKLQKRAARIILDADSPASSVKLFNKFKWIPFHEQAKVAKFCIKYKRLKGACTCLPSSETHSRQTRYANFTVACPIVKRQKEGELLQ